MPTVFLFMVIDTSKFNLLRAVFVRLESWNCTAKTFLYLFFFSSLPSYHGTILFTFCMARSPNAFVRNNFAITFNWTFYRPYAFTRLLKSTVNILKPDMNHVTSHKLRKVNNNIVALSQKRLLFLERAKKKNTKHSRPSILISYSTDATSE